jgi:F0F1-type ATP synthase membrane subunit c/vacuolar-type H+-ATPase subunit K
MARSLKTLRTVQWAMLLSILLYVAVGEVLGPRIQHVDPVLSYLFSTLAVGIVGTIFVVRRTLVLRAASTLARQPEDNLSLSQWKTGYITTYALCEALALFGLVLRFRGSELRQSLLFYIGGFVLLFFFRPRQPEAQPST